MDIAYSIGGRPFKRDGDALWDRNGAYVGRIRDDGMIFAPSGTYLGEFRNEYLAYKFNHATRHASTHSPRSVTSATSRMNRVGRVTPVGYEDFHGCPPR